MGEGWRTADGLGGAGSWPSSSPSGCSAPSCCRSSSASPPPTSSIPLADWLQRHGLRRGPATLLITALFFAAFAVPPAGHPAGGDRAGDRAGGEVARLLRRVAHPHPAPRSSGSSARRWWKAVGRGPGLALRAAGAELCRHGPQQRRAVEPGGAQPGLARVHHADRHLLPAARLGPAGGRPPRRGPAPPDRPAARRLAHETDEVLSGFLRGQSMVCTLPRPVLRPGTGPGRARLRGHHRLSDRPVLVHPLCRHVHGGRGRADRRGLPVRRRGPGGPGRGRVLRSASSSRAIS